MLASDVMTDFYLFIYFSELNCIFCRVIKVKQAKGTRTSGEELASAGTDLFRNQVQFPSESAHKASGDVISQACIRSKGKK